MDGEENQYIRSGVDTISYTGRESCANGVSRPDGSLMDSNIKYFGRWDFGNPAKYASHWGGAYIKVNFTGTGVKIKLGNTGSYYVKIDGGPWVSYYDAGGVVNITPFPLEQGIHRLIVAQGKDCEYEFAFEGLILDAGAETISPEVGEYLIEFIGDSITTGYADTRANVSSYAWICAESLKSEHTQIAYPGIALVTGYGFNEDKTGMEKQYFKQKCLGHPSSPDWDFDKYTPGIIVINLGTNDEFTGVADFVFQSKYTVLLAELRAKYPLAEIFALRCFGGYKSEPVLRAVNSRIASGDGKVHYVDTEGWLDTSDYCDGTHPSDSGQIKAAKELAKILSIYQNRK